MATVAGPILPQYNRYSAEPSPTRRRLLFAAKLLLAAGYGIAVVLLPQTIMYTLAIPIGVMLLLTLWLLPDRKTFPLGVLKLLYLPLLCLMILWPVYLAIAVPGLPWLTPTRMLLFVVIFFLLYSISTSSALRHHLVTVARSSRAMWLGFCTWQVMMIVTLPLSDQTMFSIRRWFDIQTEQTSVFFLGCLLFTRRKWVTRTCVALVVCAVIASLDGMYELRLGYPPWAPHIPSFMRVDEAIMANVLGAQSRSGDGLYRVHGQFPNSLIYAEYLALCMPFVLHWMVTGRSIVLRLAMMVAWPVIFYAILISQSRLGLVGTIIGTLVYMGLWTWRRWKSERSGLLDASLMFGFPMIAALLIMVMLSSTAISTRVLGGGAQAASDNSRKTQRQMAVPRIIRNPIGYGLGRNGHVLGFRNQMGFTTVDNDYITTVLDLGVVGIVALFGGLYMGGAYTGVRLFLDAPDRESELAGPIASSLIAFIVIKWVLSQENNHGLVFLLLAMMLALKARDLKLVPADGSYPVPDRVGQPALPVHTPAPVLPVPTLPAR